MKYNLLLILVFFIFGCSKEEKNYFPLEKIKTWNYSIMKLSQFIHFSKKMELFFIIKTPMMEYTEMEFNSVKILILILK